MAQIKEIPQASGQREPGWSSTPSSPPSPAASRNALSVSDFDYSLDFENIDFRERPHLYRVGRGEQGVLLVEPYKSELLPYWRFRTEEVARESAEKIYSMFL